MSEPQAQSKPNLLRNPRLASKIGAGVATTFSQFFNFQPSSGVATIEPSLHCRGDLVGVIGMAQGKGLREASMIVSFPADSLLPLMTRIYQTECNSINELVQGAAAELTNVIFGMLKKDLNEHEGFSLKMALPEIFLKDRFSAVNEKHGECLCVPFQTPQGEFWVSVALCQL